jgi:hypothetical protein
LAGVEEDVLFSRDTDPHDPPPPLGGVVSGHVHTFTARAEISSNEIARYILSMRIDTDKDGRLTLYVDFREDTPLALLDDLIQTWKSLAEQGCAE